MVLEGTGIMGVGSERAWLNNSSSEDDGDAESGESYGDSSNGLLDPL